MPIDYQIFWSEIETTEFYMMGLFSIEVVNRFDSAINPERQGVGGLITSKRARRENDLWEGDFEPGQTPTPLSSTVTISTLESDPYTYYRPYERSGDARKLIYE